MFTEHEKSILIDALDMADKSNTRAQNTRSNPDFKVIHEKIRTDIAELTAKIRANKLNK